MAAETNLTSGIAASLASGETILTSGETNPDDHEEEMLRELFRTCDDEIRTGQVRSVDLINSLKVDLFSFYDELDVFTIR